MLADIAGHGAVVASAAKMLRSLMQRFINSKSQTRLIHDLNREFTRLSADGRFATAIVATYLSNRNRFTLCNAGHPRPLWYRSQLGLWAYINDDVVETSSTFNLPLGFDASGAYQQVGLTIVDGDILIFYTDALTEARNVDDKLLGVTGLLRIVAGLPTADVRAMGRGVLEGVREYAAGRPLEDDATIFVLRFSATRRRFPGWRERLRGYAKVLGFKRM